MTAKSAFYDYLMPELAGITTPMLDQHLVMVAREFCSETLVVRADAAALDLVSSQAAYTLAAVADLDPVKVLRLTVSDAYLWGEDDIETDDKKYRVANTPPKYGRDDPPFAFDADMAAVTLITDEVPTADATGALVMRLVWKPTLAAATLPAVLLNQYVEAIRFGVLGRLMVMAKKPWSAPDQGVMYASKFTAAKAFAATQAQHGFTRKPLRVRKWG